MLPDWLLKLAAIYYVEGRRASTNGGIIWAIFGDYCLFLSIRG